MDVLLLSGYRSEPPVGLQKLASGEILLDRQIYRLQSLGLSPIVVLAGEGSDAHLRQSRLLEKCELVYDSNGREANLFTNLRAGLYATEQACFVLPVEIPVPPEQVWKHLKMDLKKQGFMAREHIFQLVTPEGAPWHYGFPLLLSLTGRKTLLEIETHLGLADEQLRYFRSAFTGAPALATGDVTA